MFHRLDRRITVKAAVGQLLHGIEDEVHDMTGRYLFDSAHSPDPSTPFRVQTTSADRTAETSGFGGPSRFCWPAERGNTASTLLSKQSFAE
jgi:hypothetical protein